MENTHSTILVATASATFATAISIYALYKWIKAEEKLSEYINTYESQKEIQKALIHNFVDIEEFPKLSKLIPQGALSFHENLARYCSEMCIFYDVPQKRVLDVGCGVGGLAFNLSKTFEEVIGSDTSYGMISAAQQLKQFSKSSTPFSIEGGKYIQMYKIELPKHSKRENVQFWDEDVCALVYKCGKFDCVVAANVITDLSNPISFLKEIVNYIKPRGLLIIADTFSWKNGPEEILDGDGTKLSLTILKEILDPNWSFCKRIDLPFCLPLSYRKTILGNSEVMVWQRKEIEF